MVNHLLARNDILLPEGTSFQLEVDLSQQIHVLGLKDRELAASIEEALNVGDNGKNLYDYLKVVSPDSECPKMVCQDGHLRGPEAQTEWSDTSLEEIKRQTCPDYALYSSAYDPHKEPMGFVTGENHPVSQEEMDCIAAIFRMGVQVMLARDRDGEFGEIKLTPDGPVLTGVYQQTYCEERLWGVKRTLEAYYAAANRENSSYPFDEAVQHIEEKYKIPEASGFRYDLPPAQRDMYYRQEMALLTGGPLMLLDPYAMAAYSVEEVKGMLDVLGLDMYGVKIPV